MSLPAFSAEKIRIAVMDLKAIGVPEKNAKVVSNMIRSELIDKNRFTIIERGQMDTILKEQGFQKTGCTDEACAVQLGRLLSARKMLIGEVSALDKGMVITIRIVDVEQGVSEYSSKEEVESEKYLSKGVTSIVNNLIDKIEYGKQLAAKSMQGYYIRGLVPGWGQFYADETIKGYVYLGAFVLTGAFTCYAITDYNKKEKDYHDLPRGLSQSEYDSKYDDKTTAADLAYVGIGLFALSYIMNWVDILFITEPEFNKKESAAYYKSTFFTFNVNPSYMNSKERSINIRYGINF